VQQCLYYNYQPQLQYYNTYCEKLS
jgi:hypothetical protein